MSDSILTQLKVLVERAVRPVRAIDSRKRRMREELLAHVMAVFQAASARSGDETSALATTISRFGDPHELTGQLQESTPWADGLLRHWERQILYRPGESSWWRAMRLAGITLMGFGAA